MSLETLINDAIRGGDVTAITLWPTVGGWQANVRRKRPGGVEGWCCMASADPAQALTRALGGEVSAAVVIPRPEVDAAPAPPAADPDEDIFG